MFELRVNGKAVWKSERQVTNVSLQSHRGEAGSLGIADEGVVDVVVTEVPLGGPLRLDQHEAALRQFERERVPAGSDQSSMTGFNYQPAADANKLTQGNLSYQTDPDNNPEPGAPSIDFNEPDDEDEDEKNTEFNLS